MRQPSVTAIRSYRIYLRDSASALARAYDFDLGSDEDAHQLATRMLDKQTIYPCVEVWDRGRLVCTKRREEARNSALAGGRVD